MKLAFVGFGVVGQGLAEILRDKSAALTQRYGFEPSIVAVVDMLKGSIYHPDGLNIATLLEVVGATGKLDAYPNVPGLVRGMDSLQTIWRSNADAVVEVTYTDINTGQPALNHCFTALKTGKHVVTTNKGPIALAYPELMELAEQNNAHIGFEGTVMSGTPALQMGMEALAGCEIHEIRGILNGTTNYILTQMESGQSYAEALAEAQALGYAEANPTADVEGHDALGKVLILANTIMNTRLQANEVTCMGITGITPDDIRYAKRNGERWKLIGSVRRLDNGRVVGGVQPVRVPLSDSLAWISGATNAITFSTDLLGEITLVGPGAGRSATGFALLGDLLGIHRKTARVAVKTAASDYATSGA